MGSDLVIYRHLKRAEDNGWKINIILPASSFPIENRNALPTTWNVFTIGNPFGIIKHWIINRFRFLVYAYYYIICKKYIEQLNVDTVISYFWGFNFSGFARYVAQKQNKKLVYLYHDRFEYFIPKKFHHRLKSFEHKNEKVAWKMLTVSKELVYNADNIKKYEVLLPISNGEYFFKEDKGEKNWIYSGSVYPNQVDFFLRLASALNKHKIVLTLVAELPLSSREKILSESTNIVLKNRFPTSEAALTFMLKSATVILTGYPEVIDEMPWVKDCFPSKFIEYCFLDTPVVAFSPKNTAFYKWCLANNFLNIYGDYSEFNLNEIVSYTLRDDFLQTSIAQQKKLISEHLDPNLIQAKFESYL